MQYSTKRIYLCPMKKYIKKEKDLYNKEANAEAVKIEEDIVSKCTLESLKKFGYNMLFFEKKRDAVLLCLIEDFGETVRVSILVKKLAKMSDICQRSANAALSHLKKEGFIVQKEGRGQKKYYIRFKK